MTETGPLSTIGNLLPRHDGQPLERRFDVQCRQGRAIFGVEVGVFDSDDRALPHDGKSVGELRVRGGEAEIVRRLRIGQLQGGMLSVVGVGVRRIW